MAFQKAVKYGVPLKMAVSGAAGAGKTYTLLSIASAIAQREGKPIALIDTESGSARLYSDLFTFDVMEMEPPFHPKRFMDAIREAEAAGYGVLIIDSLSHAWNGPGGVLTLVEQTAKAMTKPDTYSAWAKATPVQDALIQAILRSPMHILVSMRAKQEYSREEIGGRTVIKKLGMEAIQRKDIEFEFTIFARLESDHSLIVEKSRCPVVADQTFPLAGAEFANLVLDWLAGAPAPERPLPAQEVQRPAQQQPQRPQPPTRPNLQSVPTAEGEEPPANEQQLQSIHKLCVALGREEPAPGSLTFSGAKALISQMSREYNEKRRQGTKGA